MMSGSQQKMALISLRVAFAQIVGDRRLASFVTLSTALQALAPHFVQ